MRKLMIPCCLWLSATLLHAGEGSGNWRSETTSEYSLEAIAKIRKNLEERAAHLEEVLGTKPELDFQYFSGVLTEEEAELDQRFREGRLSRRATEEHALEFVADYERVRKSLLPLEEKARAKWRESAEAVQAKNEYTVCLASFSFFFFSDAAAHFACPGNAVPEIKAHVALDGYVCQASHSAACVEALEHFSG